ncbi:uncharacterized protein FIESC28_07349 [Fusarium coffeatum]|uniref:HNH nuclease domain-containing protein n=1 Tax=Fusarium coffeatum TaxID=231269 RepID=A0A366RE37_9HYPO|nr:uncharacterized protein FIESC28_07349 [Fusarium coffeatum]RBR15414.1 hypothetical protein FIESC28_07349 [Fusarium coffeatum]
MVPPRLHHQSSLMAVIDFSEKPPLTADQRASTTRRFFQILEHFRDHSNRPAQEYDRVELVRQMYNRSADDKSKDYILHAFFLSAGLSIDSNEDINFNDSNELRASLNGFADYLFDNFFLPLKVNSAKTPQPSPATHSAVMRALEQEHEYIGTPQRVSILRAQCLERDRHRCVVSRKFEEELGEKRYNLEMGGQKDAFRDEDGVSLHGQKFDALKVAHILPHSLTKVEGNRGLAGDSRTLFESQSLTYMFQTEAQQTTLKILNMLDAGVAHKISGTDIDRPGNALTLTQLMHKHFGRYKIFFKPAGPPEHTYEIKTFLAPPFREGVPVTRTLFITASKTIDPPDPRLLAIHSAIAHILHLSGAGEYIDHILRDADEYGIRHDGSTELHRLLGLHLNNWTGFQDRDTVMV